MPLLVSPAGPGWLKAHGEKGWPDVYFRCGIDADRLFIRSMSVEAALPLTAATLRRVPIGRIEAAINALPHLREWAMQTLGEPDQPVPWQGSPEVDEPMEISTESRERLTRPSRTSPPGEFYARVARAYVDLVPQTNRPAVAMAEEAGVPVATARRWINEARRRGMLRPGKQGKAQ